MNKTEELYNLARQSGMIRVREVRERGIAPVHFSRLARQGKLTRISRGLYELTAGADITEHHTLVEASLLVPRGIICLLSALRFHNLTTQLPHEVWMALDRRYHVPRVKYPMLHIVRFGGLSLTSGVEVHTLEGKEVRIYGIAKTIADCFKYRNKIGLDIAIEALTEAWQHRRITMSDLLSAARVDRVDHVMRPYIEAVIQ